MKRLEAHNIDNKEAILAVINSYLDNGQGYGGVPRVAPLENAAEYLESIGAHTVIKQFPVQDPDYFAEFNAFYSKTFEPTNKYCHRFHFFSESIENEEEILAYIDRMAMEADKYLGFITIRPTRSSPVAATILRSPENEHFILSKDKFVVHMAGQTFHVKGTPFLQQDNAVGACAQAAIWMALRTIRQKEGDSAFDPAQITDAATRYWAGGRVLPNREGLQITQMLEAVRFAGYSSHMISLGKPGTHLTGDYLKRAQRLIYTYIESEIPVVLALFPTPETGHAVVLIGHGWNDSNDLDIYTNIDTINAKFSIKHAVSWVDHFYIHNDNTGPYLRFDLDSGSYSLKHAAYAIPLLPSDVFMSGEEAELASSTLLIQILFGSYDPGNLKGFLEKIVLRTYLSERYKFREWVKDSSMADELKSHYRQKSMPKRVWITELNLLDGYNNAHTGNGKRIGEIIMDATGDPNDAPFLSVHINLKELGVGPIGILIDRDPVNGNNIKIIPVINDEIYSCLTR